MNNREDALKTYKVLVVEDEDKIRNYVCKSLGYLIDNVLEAANGQDALNILENYSPDIIITDIEMPIMNGIELIKHIRKKNQEVSIVVLTAYDNKEYLYELIDMHLDYYVIKPINFDKLVSILYCCQDRIEETKKIDIKLPYGYVYDASKKILFYKEETILLSKREIDFLELLFKYKNRVVNYKEFQNYIWKDDFMSDNAIKSLVKNIRRKLPKNFITNLSGVGYKLEKD